MILYLHNADMDDVNITFQRHVGREVKHRVFPADVGADGFLDRITAALTGGRGSLELLVINCHGINVPGTAVGLLFGAHRVFNADDMRVFDGLAPWWARSNQGIEVHSCQMARGADGRRVCQSLADHAGAAVYAGLSLQSGSVPGADTIGGSLPYGPAIVEEFVTGRYAGAPDSWGYFEGPVLRFDPAGTMPHDAYADLMARGAWRSGTERLTTSGDIAAWEATHALAGPDVPVCGAAVPPGSDDPPAPDPTATIGLPWT